MSIGSVQENLARLSQESESRTSLDTLRREAAEAKLYYMRDTLDPEAFDELVEDEIRRSLINTEPDCNIKDLAKKAKKRISSFFK